MLRNQSIIADIKAIIAQSRHNAIRSVNHQRTLMYWHIGKRIFEEEQEGKDRADYGTFLIKYPSEQLQPEFGSGFSVRQINLYRQFYRTFPIVHALHAQLSWTPYKLLELGNGFSFVARQKRIHIEGDEFFADLVFYNRLLQCFVIIEIKTTKLTHQNIGQLQMYVNYYALKSCHTKTLQSGFYFVPIKMMLLYAPHYPKTKNKSLQVSTNFICQPNNNYWKK